MPPMLQVERLDLERYHELAVQLKARMLPGPGILIRGDLTQPSKRAYRGAKKLPWSMCRSSTSVSPAPGRQHSAAAGRNSPAAALVLRALLHDLTREAALSTSIRRSAGRAPQGAAPRLAPASIRCDRGQLRPLRRLPKGQTPETPEQHATQHL